MKVILMILLGLIAQFSFAQSDKSDVNKASMAPVINWDVDTTDLGDIDPGDIIEFDLGFTNVGKSDLVIEVVTACKCIEIDYPRSPIGPGQRGNIVVVFDSLGVESGRQRKTIDVISNTDPIVVEAFVKTNILPKNPK
jgi:hypothetical protein